MIGYPRYDYGDKVKFKFAGKDYEGTVEIVDAFGTFEQNDEPSYDILGVYEGETTLFKHIRESRIY